MNILMLTPYLPYPLLSGGQIRTYNLLKNLKAKHQITLFSLIKQDTETKHINHLTQFCHDVKVFKRSQRPFTPKNILKAGFSTYPFVVTRNLVPSVIKAVEQELATNHYDLIHAETFYMMPNIPETQVPIILVEQTIEYLGYLSYAQKSQLWPLKPLLYVDINKIQKWESFYWQHCDRLITMSENDKDYILSRHPQISHINVVANGVDSIYFKQTKKHLPKDPTVLIVGTFKWLPNIEAVTYLVDEIWPLIQKKLPRAKLNIVGFSPTEKILAYAKNPSISVRGDVADIREAYGSAHVLLAPVLSGKGTRYKILEAMATKTPIVATPLAIEGIAGITDGTHVLVGQTAHELAQKTVEVLTNIRLQHDLAQASEALVNKHYNWQAISHDLDAVYQELGSRTNA